MNYGLIGKPLKHSFSKEIHGKLADYQYELKELDKNSFDVFMKKKDFKGINVTIPYKQIIIPYLDYIDEDAKIINAVNTVVNDNGVLRGYNTDILGVLATFDRFGIEVNNKNILILGTGATSNTIHYALKKRNAKKIYKAYRKSSTIKGDVLYEDINNTDATTFNSNFKFDDINMIINATSNGTYPHADDPLLVDLSIFKNLTSVMDVVYNPLRTNLLIDSEKYNIISVSGLYMLIAQAFYASRLFLNCELSAINTSPLSHSDITCESTYKACLHDKLNIVLTGMPTCGKSTVGKKLANILSLNFIDTDVEIEKRVGMSTSNYITKFGEKKFRDIEAKTIKDLSTLNNTVISTGGGSILREENITNLKHNGKIYFMNRSIALLHPTNDRPLTNSYQSLKKKYDERLPLYKKYCDKEINGDLEIEERTNIIIKDFT